jgi:hypothetical protein
MPKQIVLDQEIDERKKKRDELKLQTVRKSDLINLKPLSTDTLKQSDNI